MKGLHKQTPIPKKDALSWMKEDEVARGKKEEIKATTMIIMRLIDYMEKHQMSQTDLARVLGVTPQYINKLIHGQDNSFRIETAIEYGQKLGIKLIEILAPEDDVECFFKMWNRFYLCLPQEKEVMNDYPVSFFFSDVFRSNKKQKWTVTKQLVTA